MIKLNEITYKEVGRLNDVQLSKLLLRLLLLEAEKKQFEGTETIVVPLRINVGDGGEDGRVKCEDTKGSRWISNKFTLFQCKATDLSPQDLYDEFFRKTNGAIVSLKEKIEEVLDANGQYVFFISKDYSATTLTNRVEKAEAAIDYANTNFNKSYSYSQIRILEGNEISTWINEYISAVILTLEFCSMSIPYGIRTWQQWKDSTTSENKLEYSAGIELKKSAESLLNLIAKEKVVRVIGHSGIGKTRFVLETFSSADVRAQVYSNMLVYIDLALIINSEILSFVVSNLQYTGLIVLDNCPESIHDSIKGMIKSTGNLKLITIDHSITTAEPVFFKIDKSVQVETVDLIIRKKYGATLPEWVVAKLIELADGYPKMADYVCDSVDKDGYEKIDLSLSPEQILNAFLKKLIFGHNEFDKDQYSIIKACSIFKEFGFIDHTIEEVASKEVAEYAQKQINVISDIACIPSITPALFYKSVMDFKRIREIVDRKGYSFYVRPEPLASNLAADWLLSFDLQNAVAFAEKLNEVGLLEQFCLRLQSLDQIPRAKYVVEKLWKPGSPFSSAEVLNTEIGSRLFRAVVEVNPEITVKSLRSLVDNLSIDEIKKIQKGRRHLIWAIEKLLYREEAFYDAAKTLFDFSVAENESIGNNATNQFLQLFHIYLSATVADYDSRIEIIKYGLSKNNGEYNRLVILALGSSLKGDGFQRIGGAETQGLNKVFFDYEPKNWEEVYQYWNYSLEMLTHFALNDSNLRELAMDQVANSTRTLFSHGQIELISGVIKKIYSANLIYWEAAINALNWALKYAEFESEKRVAIKELLSFITPMDIKSQFTMFVSKPDWQHENDADGNYIDIAELNVSSFVDDLYNKKVDIKDYFAILLEGEQRQGLNFGINISNKYGHQLENGKRMIQELRKIKKEFQNPSILAGLLYKSDKIVQEALLDLVINDSLINNHAFYLMTMIKPTKNDIFKLFSILEKEPTYIIYFNNFQAGRVLDNLRTDEVIEICEKIAEYDLQGKWVSLAIISQYCYNNQKLWIQCKKFIEKLILSESLLKASGNVRTMDAYHWSNLSIKLLKEDRNDSFAESISKQVLEEFEEIRVSSTNVYVKNLCAELVNEYFEVFWKVISQGLFGKAFWNIKFTLGSQNGSMREKGILFNGNLDLIFDWCKTNPTGAKRIAYMMPVYEIVEGKHSWHPFALRMLNAFGNEDGFLSEFSANIGSFSAVGSSVGYYEMQIDLIKQLTNHSIFVVKQWAKEKIKVLEKMIIREKLDEEAEK